MKISNWMTSVLWVPAVLGSIAPSYAQDRADLGAGPSSTTASQTGVAGGAVAPSSADEAVTDSETSSEVSEVIVTARRIQERLQDVPISITVYNQEQLADRNVVSSNDLVAFTPSLTSNSKYGEETATFALRGFVQDAQTSPSVAVYFADVSAPRAQGGTNGGNGAGVGSFFDLQNVQVLKGPQGTLFGRNTTGGAILLVPTKPTSLREGCVEGSIGDYNMRRVQGVFNTPLGDDVRIRLGIDRQTRDGYLHNRSDIGPDDFQNTDYLAARASLVADLTPDLETYFILQYSHSDTNGGLGKVAGTNTDENCSPTASAVGGATLFGPLVCSQMLARARSQNYGYWDVENSNTNPLLEIEQTQLINTTTWLATDSITLKNIASYSEFTQAQNSAIWGSNVVFPESFGSIAGQPIEYVDLYKDPERDNVSQKSFTEEVQLQGAAASIPLTYQMGLYYERSQPLDGYQGSLTPIFLSCANAETLQCADYLGSGFVQNSLSKYEFENIGLYTQGTYNLTDRWSITGGLRYTIDKTTATGATRQYRFPFDGAPTVSCSNGAEASNPDNCAISGTQKSEKPTWLINLDYKPTRDAMLYAKYARGYRQGGVNASSTDVFDWAPEQVDAYELGAKTTFRGAVSGTLNVAAFYNDFQKQQLFAGLTPDGSDPTATPSQAIVNAGTSEIKGLEVDGSLLPGAGFSLNFGYAYLSTKLKSYDAPLLPGYLPPEPTSEVGGSLASSPEHKLSITGSYALPINASLGDVTISATFSHTAEQIVDSTSPFGVMPSTNLWNLNFRWKSVVGSAVDAAAFVTNLTNEKYPVYNGGFWAPAGYDTLILGPPRMYGVRLRYNFGG